MIPTSRRQQAGFTVIEMMCAAIVVGLLVLTVSSTVGDFTVKAKLASTKMNCRVVQSVIVGYSTDRHGDVPTSRAQYVSSPTYQSLQNPFNVTQRGIGKWGSSLGTSSADNDSPQAPVAIWNVDPAEVALNGTAGVVFYTPYRDTRQAQTGANNLPLGGDGGSSGYSAYAIEAMGIITLANPVAVPYGDSRITN